MSKKINQNSLPVSDEEENNFPKSRIITFEKFENKSSFKRLGEGGSNFLSLEESNNSLYPVETSAKNHNNEILNNPQPYSKIKYIRNIFSKKKNRVSKKQFERSSKILTQPVSIKQNRSSTYKKKQSLLPSNKETFNHLNFSSVLPFSVGSSIAPKDKKPRLLRIGGTVYRKVQVNDKNKQLWSDSNSDNSYEKISKKLQNYPQTIEYFDTNSKNQPRQQSHDTISLNSINPAALKLKSSEIYNSSKQYFSDKASIQSHNSYLEKSYANSHVFDFDSESSYGFNQLKKSNRMVKNIQDDLILQKLLIKFGLCLVNYGAPTYRAQFSLNRLSKVLNLQTNIEIFHSFILINFLETNSRASKTEMLNTSPVMDFYKLDLVDALFEDVINGKIGYKQALSTLKVIETTSRLYPKWTGFLISCILPMCAAQYAFRGGFKEIAISFLLGGFVGTLVLISTKLKGFQNIMQFIAAFTVSFICTAIRKYACYNATTLSAIFTQMPGLALTTGIMEIMAGSLISGTARVFKSIIVLLTLSFSLQLGNDMFFKVSGIIDTSENLLDAGLCTPVNPLFTFIFLPISIVSNMILFNTSHKRFPLCLVIAGLMYGLFYILSEYAKLKSGSTFFSALFTGLLSNTASRIFDVAPYIPLVCSVTLLVPGSLGLKSFSVLLEGNSSSDLFLRVFTSCLAIMLGLFLASFIVFPKGRNKAASLMSKVPGVIPSAAAGVPLTPAKRTRLEYSTVAKTGLIDIGTNNTSVVVPIFKNGNCQDPNNYRGISLIPTLTKLIGLFGPITLPNWYKLPQMEITTLSCPLSPMLFDMYINDIFTKWSDIHEMAINAGKCGVMQVNCEPSGTFQIQKNIVSIVQKYTYLGLIFTNTWKCAGTINNNKTKMQNSMYDAYNFLKNQLIPTAMRLKVLQSVLIPIGTYGGELFGMSEYLMVIKAIIQAVATYGGELFGMSATRCKPIQQVADAATRTLAKCGKSAAMVRLRIELSLTDLNIKTAVARTRAFGKWASLRTWISDLIKCPYKHRCDTWIADTEAGTSCNWMGLKPVYPELKKHINYVFKIRNGTY
ncbi:hypothetical protein BB561_004665 [Smittium simulii]|uniref:Threonine/serine exporter-like N-terminal domain-containing protein n=1 Tax=Smittium simulii TaxID=133385 RepID=A0A2T9YEY7_9FUNG|nr:hypothetical protein BB561_004665 [Smittium simulii]